MNTKNNEPNLFIIVRNQDNVSMYYNGIDKEFYSDLANATWARKAVEAQAIINHFHLANSEVIKIKESEYVFAKANAMTKIIIIADSLSKYLQDAISSLPNRSQEMKFAHKHLKNAANSLKVLTPDFEHFLRTREDDVFDVQGYYEEFIMHLADLSFQDLPNWVGLVESFKEDPKSVIGICKKVLKEKERKKIEKEACRNKLSILDQV